MGEALSEVPDFVMKNISINSDLLSYAYPKLQVSSLPSLQSHITINKFACQSKDDLKQKERNILFVEFNEKVMKGEGSTLPWYIWVILSLLIIPALLRVTFILLRKLYRKAKHLYETRIKVQEYVDNLVELGRILEKQKSLVSLFLSPK